MKEFWKSLSLKKKIIITNTIIILLFIALFIGYILPFMEKLLIDEQKAKIREIVKLTVSSIETIHQNYITGLITEDDAKQQVKGLVRSFRFGKDNMNCLWISDTYPSMVLNPLETALEGQDLSEFVNSEERKLFVEFTELAKEKNEGFIEHLWSKVGSREQIKKITFIKFFKPWDWVIGTGIFYDDYKDQINSISYKLMLSLGVILIVMIIVNFFVFKQVFSQLKNIINMTSKISDGDLTLFIPQKHYLKCVEAKKCEFTGCRAYDSRNLSCWRIEGTCSDDGNPFESDEEKRKKCLSCKVYKNAVRNEFEELIESLNNMIVRFKTLISDIQQMAYGINNNTDNLIKISDELKSEAKIQSERFQDTARKHGNLVKSVNKITESANQQADRVAQTNAAMEELSSTINLVVKNSVDVSNSAKEAVDEASKTDEILLNTTQSINQIAESSKKIDDIIAIINDISEKINLLSLNAAIEAARAGEYGRGFAVVADEISKLAEATAGSTNEIETLIKQSRSDIQMGAELVSRTTSAIEIMVEKINEASKLMEEIALSSDEQTKGSDQVMEDVEIINLMASQIVEITTEQKATSDELMKAAKLMVNSIDALSHVSGNIDDASRSIKSQFDILTGTIDKFKV